MTTITLNTIAPAADVLVLFAAPAASQPQVLAKLKSPAAAKKIAAAAAGLNFTAKVGESCLLPGAVAGLDGTVMLVGVGKKPNHESFRRSTGSAVRALAGQKKAAIMVPAEHVDAIGAIAEGVLLGGYSFTTFRNKSLTPQKVGLKAAVLVSDEAKNPIAKSAVARAQSVSRAVNAARDMANTPPGHLPPTAVAEIAKELAGKHGLALQVLDEKAMAKQGFGGIVGVGQGSANPPRLIRLAYTPKNSVAKLALVGKGITFDTGGISIKPALNMHEMKADMSGAAAVIQAISAIAELKLPVSVVAYAACAENMPGGRAQRPGDVVTAYGGRTVEVLNTDAEGRLVLMDALVRAQEDRPDLVVDVATLTGAASVALGRRIAAVLSPQDEIRNHLVDAAARSGESFWPLPLPAEYRPKLDSSVADIANIGEPYGGTLYGGLFLQDFIEDGQNWAHLDIAPPAFNSEAPFDYTPKGATGSAVRTLVTLAEDIAAGLLKL